jgi:hypothetical protein
MPPQQKLPPWITNALVTALLGLSVWVWNRQDARQTETENRVRALEISQAEIKTNTQMILSRLDKWNDAKRNP